MDGSFIKNTAYFTYGFVLLLLILVLLTPPIKGARSWFYFSGFSIQPSEFIKLTLSLSIAKLLSDVGSRFQEFRTKLKAFFEDKTFEKGEMICPFCSTLMFSLT